MKSFLVCWTKLFYFIFTYLEDFKVFQWIANTIKIEKNNQNQKTFFYCWTPQYSECAE